MSDIKNLRAEVLRRQKAVNAKMSRLKKQGVVIAGSEHDVRRNPANVGRYNSRQLQTYLGDLNQFMKRTNQFVGGLEGTPIRKGVWERFKAQEAEFEQFVTKHYDSLADTFVDTSGATIREFDSEIRARRERGKGGVPRPLEFFSPVQQQGVVSEKALEKIRAGMVEKLKPGFVPKVTQKARFSMLQAVESFGDESLSEKINALTDEQIDTLFNYTDAPRDLFSAYRNQKLFSQGKRDEVDMQTLESDKEEVNIWLDWAASLPPRENGSTENEGSPRRRK